IVARDLLGLEIVEGAAEILALAQDGDPGEPGLEAVEDQLLVERAVVIFGDTPFGVMIGDVERVLPRPGAAALAVGMPARGGAHATVCFVTGGLASGSARRMPSPPAVSCVPASSASATRSVRIKASPFWPAVEPMVPTALSPAITAVPA